jgi:hypothetical protein
VTVISWDKTTLKRRNVVAEPGIFKINNTLFFAYMQLKRILSNNFSLQNRQKLPRLRIVHLNWLCLKTQELTFTSNRCRKDTSNSNCTSNRKHLTMSWFIDVNGIKCI